MAHFLYYIFPHQVGQIASLVIDEFIKLASAGYGETEFRRAKKQLQVGQFHTQSSQKQKHIFFTSAVNAPDELGITASGIRGFGTPGLVQWRT